MDDVALLLLVLGLLVLSMVFAFHAAWPQAIFTAILWHGLTNNLGKA